MEKRTKAEMIGEEIRQFEFEDEMAELKEREEDREEIRQIYRATERSEAEWEELFKRLEGISG